MPTVAVLIMLVGSFTLCFMAGLAVQHDFGWVPEKNETLEQYAPTVERCVADCERYIKYITGERITAGNDPVPTDDPSLWGTLYKPETDLSRAECVCVTPHGLGVELW